MNRLEKSGILETYNAVDQAATVNDTAKRQNRSCVAPVLPARWLCQGTKSCAEICESKSKGYWRARRNLNFFLTPRLSVLRHWFSTAFFGSGCSTDGAN